MAAVLAFLSAVAYGSGDFLGGLAARRIPVVAVALRSNAIGLAGVLVATLFVTADRVTTHDLAAGGLGGIAGCIGILLLYQGLASGMMSVVAPVSAVLAALVPVAWGLAGGERPSLVVIVGIPVAVTAIVLLAREPRGQRLAGRRLAAPILFALGAGLGFGFFFIGLDAAGDDAGLWPVVAGRVASVSLLAIVTLARGAAAHIPPSMRTARTRGLVISCGLLDSGANALFLLATQRGLLTIVAVLGSLYPATTVVLARWVLEERLSRPQLVGCGLAVAAVALVSAG
jgi:uncharacterized membrane protein